MAVTSIVMTSAGLQCHLVAQKPRVLGAPPSPLLRHDHLQKSLLIARSSNKEAELTAMQNFKSDLNDALKKATTEAAAAQAAADANSNEPDLIPIEGADFWSTIKSLPPKQLAICLCYTNKCIPCKAAKPIIIQWVRDINKKEEKIIGFKFALTLPNKDVAIAMGVKTSPVFLFFKNGELIHEIRGGKELPLVKEFMDQNS